MIRPRVYERVLTVATARIGQRVQVYSHPHLYPCPFYGEEGTIKAFPDPQHWRAVAGVDLDNYPCNLIDDYTTVTWIPLHELHPLD